MSGGGVGVVSAATQTTTAPLLRISSAVTHGERSGAASNKTLGRLGAETAISAAVRGSPVTIASFWPVRRSKLSAKNRPMARAGWATFRSVAVAHGNSTIKTGTNTAGTSNNPAQAKPSTRW